MGLSTVSQLLMGDVRPQASDGPLVLTQAHLRRRRETERQARHGDW